MQKDKYGTILVIDDNEAILTALRYCLSGTFQRIITKSSPDSVLTILTQEVVNLVLLDVDMPVWDGFKTLAAIRTDRKLKDTPVIMLTAAADLGSVVKANEYGVQDYIKKPFLPDELADRVAKVIWDNWQQQGVGGRPRNPENRPIYEEF